MPARAGASPRACIADETIDDVEVAFVALVAEAEGYVPDVDLRHLEVTLRVATSTEAGVTEIDFDVARLFDHRH